MGAVETALQKIITDDLKWTATEVPGTAVAALAWQAVSGPPSRRLGRRRHRGSEDEERGGPPLLDVPGYRFPAVVTSLPDAPPPPRSAGRGYNGRADWERENGRKEHQAGFALPPPGLDSLWAGEAAGSRACLTGTLLGLFEQPPGWPRKVTRQNLRFWLFATAGGLSHPAGKTTIPLAGSARERAGWRRCWEKILSPLPHCHAVEPQPAFTS